ncbi:hypothetical protein SLE2022_236190 [Rubroshorea leprosula]
MISDEIQIRVTEDEIKKLKLLEEADTVPLTSNKPLIQKVPSSLCSCYSQRECRRYFKPISVAIGPLSHRKKTKTDLRFEGVEKWKSRLAAMFIKSSRGTALDFYENVKKKIYSLRECYNFKGGQKWTDENLAWMFLVDGCALLHFIILDANGVWEKFRVENGLVCIEKIDIFLLENQLPYQLLEILIDSFVEFSPVELRQERRKSFKKYITEFVNRIFWSLIAPEQHQIHVDHSQPRLSHEQQEEEEEEDPVHLLDLLRRRLMGVKLKKNGNNPERFNEAGSLETLLKEAKSEEQPSISICNVKELKEKGILFKARKKVDAITDIDFNYRCCMPTLTLAPISLPNTTMPLLLNLMAYELCSDFKEDRKITSYLSFLDSLIDNGEDVKELREAGVLHHGLGSDEAVAKLFNKISRILVPKLERDSILRRNIHEYCSNKSHPRYLYASTVAKLTDTYFRSPWSFVVFLVALVGLIMTAMEVYYSFEGISDPY